MDYGHRLEFGYFLIPDADDPRGVLETAHLDTLALLGVILGQTERIRVFEDVANLPRCSRAFAATC